MSSVIEFILRIRVSFICIGLGQGHSTRGLVSNSSETRLCRNYSGPRVEFPCTTPIHHDVYFFSLFCFFNFCTLPVSHRKIRFFPVGQIANIIHHWIFQMQKRV